MRSRFFALTAAIVLAAHPAFGWGLLAHHLQARAALAGLPQELPPFFRNAGKRLEWLTAEPDRWRNAASPFATEATGGNHILALEWAPPPWPAHRHAYIAALARNGRLAAQNDSLRRIGTAQYAIVEAAEILTAAFRRWRQLPENDPERAQLEQSILVYAGVLGHWVTDSSMPLHCTVHVLGWHASVPNPKGYSTDPKIHQQVEDQFVGQIFARGAAIPALPPAPATVEDWMAPLPAYFQSCNAKVESIYQLEKTGAFHPGQHSPPAETLILAALHEGAAQLRDYWWNCWRRSQ